MKEPKSKFFPVGANRLRLLGHKNVSLLANSDQDSGCLSVNKND